VKREKKRKEKKRKREEKESNMIPPTFGKVRKLMLKRVLHYFKGN